ncbi:unnamed protein product [Arabidopsis thaliana]|nr:unnamed protein product [Arabidopsis thaliana]
MALNDTKEWLDNTMTNEQQNGNRNADPSRNTKWSPPGRDKLKCNYDASHHERNTVSGLGWILRNSQGTVIECGMGKFQGRMTTEEAECSTLIWAIQASYGFGHKKVIFEGDNQTITRMINTKSSNPRLQHFLDTIQSWIPSFESIEFSFKHREQNGCADFLAKQAIKENTQWSLFHSCPYFLSPYVNNDYS